MLCPKLFRQILIPIYRPLDERREVADIERQFEDVLLGLDPAAVNVNDIANGFERIIAQADGDQQVQPLG